MAIDNLYSTGPIEYLVQYMSELEQLRKKSAEQFSTLTNREVEILTMIAMGLKNPGIAKELEISRVTVQNHRAQLRCKLNIENQADFVKYALAYDLIQL